MKENEPDDAHRSKLTTHHLTTGSDQPLAGTLVVSLDQAVAAPLTARRLADAGARVVELERPEGIFARLLRHRRARAVHPRRLAGTGAPAGPVVADLGKAADRRLFEALVAKADVLFQKPRAGGWRELGYTRIEVRCAGSTRGSSACSISGYGDEGPYRDRKAYDLLIQAESGLTSVTGGPEAPARVGVSVVDIATGMHAYEAILGRLISAGAPAGRTSASRCSTP